MARKPIAYELKYQEELATLPLQLRAAAHRSIFRELDSIWCCIMSQLALANVPLRGTLGVGVICVVNNKMSNSSLVEASFRGAFNRSLSLIIVKQNLTMKMSNSSLDESSFRGDLDLKETYGSVILERVLSIMNYVSLEKDLSRESNSSAFGNNNVSVESCMCESPFFGCTVDYDSTWVRFLASYKLSLFVLVNYFCVQYFYYRKPWGVALWQLRFEAENYMVAYFVFGYVLCNLGLGRCIEYVTDGFLPMPMIMWGHGVFIFFLFNRMLSVLGVINRFYAQVEARRFEPAFRLACAAMFISGYLQMLAVYWNALMHALNGNILPIDEQEAGMLFDQCPEVNVEKEKELSRDQFLDVSTNDLMFTSIKELGPRVTNEMFEEEARLRTLYQKALEWYVQSKQEDMAGFKNSEATVLAAKRMFDTAGNRLKKFMRVCKSRLAGQIDDNAQQERQKIIDYYKIHFMDAKIFGRVHISREDKFDQFLRDLKPNEQKVVWDYCELEPAFLNALRKTRSHIETKMMLKLDEGHAKSAKTKVIKRYDKGRVATRWRVPYHECEPVPKPKEYRTKVFRRWVCYEAYRLYKNMTENQKNDKTLFISGNLACQALYYGTMSGSKPMMKNMLEHAQVFVDSYKEIQAPKPPVEQNLMFNFVHLPKDISEEDKEHWRGILSFLDGRYLYLNGKMIYSADEFRVYENSKNASVRKKVAEYFKGNGERLALQKLIDSMALKGELAPVAEKKFVENEELEFVNDFGIVPENPDIMNSQGAATNVGEEVWKQKPEIVTEAVSINLVRKPYEAGYPKSKPKQPLAVLEKPKLKRQVAVDDEGFTLVKRIGKTKLVETFQGNFFARGELAVRHELKHDIAVKFDMTQLAPAISSVGLTISRVVALLLALATCNDYRNNLAVIYNFLSGEPRVLNHFMSRYNELNQPIVLLQAAADEVQGYTKNFWAFVASSILGVIVSTQATGMWGTLKPFVSEFGWHLNFSLLKLSAVKLAQHLLDAILEFISRIGQCIDKGTLSPLWGQKWDPYLWLDFSSTYLNENSILVTANPFNLKSIEKLIAVKKLPDTWKTTVTLDEFRNILLEHMDQGRELMRYFSERHTLVAKLASTIRQLDDLFHQLIVVDEVGESRVAPFVIYLYGKPGQGKTTMCRELIRAIALMNGYDPSDSSIYTWVNGANFQDGLDGRHWCIVFDDVDTTKVQQTPPTYCDHFINLVNNKPYQIEKANVNEKGKFYAKPHLIVYCSNVPCGNAHLLLSTPYAFARRVSLHYEIEANSKFVTNGVIDPKKVKDEVDVSMMRLNRFKEDCSLVPTGNFMWLRNEMRNIQDAFKKHLERQERQLGKSRSNVHCSKCGLNVSYNCNCEDLQGIYSDAKFKVSEFLARTFGVTRLWDPAHERKIMLTMIAVGCGGLFALAKFVSAIKPLSELLQAREMNTVEGHAHPTWLRADQTNAVKGLPTTPSTWTKEELVASVKASTYTLSNEKLKLYGLSVGTNLLAVPTHFFEDKLDWTLQTRKRTIAVPYDASSIYVSTTNPELCYVRFFDLDSVSVYAKLPGSIDDSISQFDASEIVGGETKLVGTYCKIQRSHRGFRVLKMDADTQDGDCGLSYICQHNSSWKVWGIHYSKVLASSSFQETSFTQGAIVTQMEVAQAAEYLGITLFKQKMIKQSLSVDGDVQTGAFNDYSEIWTAVSHHNVDVETFGQITPPLPGSSMKTKCEDTIFRSDFNDLEQSICGQVGYWRIPHFRGKMIDEKWVSPFSNAFVTQNFAQPDITAMKMALMDYVGPIHTLDCEGYGVASEFTAIRGDPVSGVNRINMNTSAGPPYCQNKRRFVSAEEALMDPNVAQMIDDIEDALENGEVPVVAAICSLKDEPVKPGKHPRVFNNLAMAMNIVLKRYFSPIKIFMKANNRFFESMVGINMTSSDSYKVIEKLKEINVDLPFVYENDAKAMDKSWNGTHYEFVAKAYELIAEALGLPSKKYYLLVMACKYVLYVMKNDTFFTCWNPSGNDITVELNGCNVSLGERYVFYRQHPDLVHADVHNWFNKPYPVMMQPFRAHVALVTYGDDNSKAFRNKMIPGYYDIWKNEYGLVMTDAQKSLEVTYEPVPFSKMSFLKRTFIFNEECQKWFPALDMKSIVRMLVMRKPSTLSKNDHAATALTEAARELVYYGRETHDKFVAQFKAIADKYNINDNPYLDLKSFDEWKPQILEDKFQTWSERKPRELAYID